MPLLLASFTATSCSGKSAKNNWWNNTEKLTFKDIVKIELVTVNNQPHRVRLIGINHDNLTDGSGKAHTTWEFADLLSDANGNSLATTWNSNDGAESLNTSFVNSNIRRVLDGGGDLKRPIAWYEKGATEKSSTYTGSVFSMLPSELQSVIKEVKKPVALGNDYVVYDNYYQAKVFVLSFVEMQKSSFLAKHEGKTYQYYLDQSRLVTSLIHKQVIHNKPYMPDPYEQHPIDDPVFITDIASNPCNFAGYCSLNCEDSPFWLRSPNSCTGEDEEYPYERAAAIDWGGSPRTFWPQVYKCAMPIAPAFCI